MKTMRIDISSVKGRATILRSGSDIVINVSRLIGKDESWVVPARPTGRCDHRPVARRLQVALDGFHGTHGDATDYLRVIEMLAD